jgi:hypothetical protein
MPNVRFGRREFVQAGLAASVMPFGSWAAASDLNQAAAGGRPARLHKLLVDRTIPESVRLGALAGAIADEVFVFDGDLTKLWNEELRLQWPNGPRPIAGLTAPGVRMVLEQLGRDHDARIVFSAEHRRVAGGMSHSLVGCEHLVRSTTLRGGGDWVGDMAKHIMACPHKPASRTASFEYETSAGAGATSPRQRLVTWVLAPCFPQGQRYNAQTAS